MGWGVKVCGRGCGDGSVLTTISYTSIWLKADRVNVDDELNPERSTADEFRNGHILEYDVGGPYSDSSTSPVELHYLASP